MPDATFLEISGAKLEYIKKASRSNMTETTGSFNR
jgi:hypothetical protein